MSELLYAAREVSFYISVAVNKALYKVLYLPGHTFGLLLGKPQQVGQEFLLLNLTLKMLLSISLMLLLLLGRSRWFSSMVSCT